MFATSEHKQVVEIWKESPKPYFWAELKEITDLGGLQKWIYEKAAKIKHKQDTKRELERKKALQKDEEKKDNATLVQ